VRSAPELAYGDPVGGHACFLTESDELFCWGDDASGQLGDATTEPGVGCGASPSTTSSG